jgi:hypothetical protein
MEPYTKLLGESNSFTGIHVDFCAGVVTLVLVFRAQEAMFLACFGLAVRLSD